MSAWARWSSSIGPASAMLRQPSAVEEGDGLRLASVDTQERDAGIGEPPGEETEDQSARPVRSR
jgi:hypothetical protein